MEVAEKIFREMERIYGKYNELVSIVEANSRDMELLQEHGFQKELSKFEGNFMDLLGFLCRLNFFPLLKKEIFAKELFLFFHFCPRLFYLILQYKSEDTTLFEQKFSFIFHKAIFSTLIIRFAGEQNSFFFAKVRNFMFKNKIFCLNKTENKEKNLQKLKENLSEYLTEDNSEKSFDLDQALEIYSQTFEEMFESKPIAKKSFDLVKITPSLKKNAEHWLFKYDNKEPFDCTLILKIGLKLYADLKIFLKVKQISVSKFYLLKEEEFINELEITLLKNAKYDESAFKKIFNSFGSSLMIKGNSLDHLFLKDYKFRFYWFYLDLVKVIPYLFFKFQIIDEKYVKSYRLNPRILEIRKKYFNYNLFLKKLSNICVCIFEEEPIQDIINYLEGEFPKNKRPQHKKMPFWYRDLFDTDNKINMNQLIIEVTTFMFNVKTQSEETKMDRIFLELGTFLLKGNYPQISDINKIRLLGFDDSGLLFRTKKNVLKSMDLLQLVSLEDLSERLNTKYIRMLLNLYCKFINLFTYEELKNAIKMMVVFGGKLLKNKEKIFEWDLLVFVYLNFFLEIESSQFFHQFDKKIIPVIKNIIQIYQKLKPTLLEVNSKFILICINLKKSTNELQEIGLEIANMIFKSPSLPIVYKILLAHHFKTLNSQPSELQIDIPDLSKLRGGKVKETFYMEMIFYLLLKKSRGIDCSPEIDDFFTLQMNQDLKINMKSDFFKFETSFLMGIYLIWEIRKNSNFFDENPEFFSIIKKVFFEKISFWLINTNYFVNDIFSIEDIHEKLYLIFEKNVLNLSAEEIVTCLLNFYDSILCNSRLFHLQITKFKDFNKLFLVFLKNLKSIYYFNYPNVFENNIDFFDNLDFIKHKILLFSNQSSKKNILEIFNYDNFMKIVFEDILPSNRILTKKKEFSLKVKLRDSIYWFKFLTLSIDLHTDLQNYNKKTSNLINYPKLKMKNFVLNPQKINFSKETLFLLNTFLYQLSENRSPTRLKNLFSFLEFGIFVIIASLQGLKMNEKFMNRYMIQIDTVLPEINGRLCLIKRNHF